MTRRRMAMLAALMMASVAASSTSSTLSQAKSEESDPHEDICNDGNKNNVESPQKEQEGADQTVINHSVGEPGSKERDVSETADDERIRGSGPVTVKPRIKRDPRPVSEQVEAYYEHICRGSGESEKESGNVDGSSPSETEEELSDVSVDSELEGLSNDSSKSGKNTSPGTLSIKTAVENESNHVDVNDETENRNQAHHDNAASSYAPNERISKESETITVNNSADIKQGTSSARYPDDRTAEEEAKQEGENAAPEPGERFIARNNPNAADPSAGKVLGSVSNTDNGVEDCRSSSSESISITDPPGEYDDEAATGTRRSHDNADDMDRTEQEPISDDTRRNPSSSTMDYKDVRTENETIPIDSPESRTDEVTAEAADASIDRSNGEATKGMARSAEEALHEKDSCENETIGQTGGGSAIEPAADKKSTANSAFPASNKTAAEPMDKEATNDVNADEEVIDFDFMDGKIEVSPEDEANEETVGNHTLSNNAPPINKVSPKKAEMEDYIDGDVIDFDIIDNLNRRTLEQVADARSDTPVIEEVASDSHDYKSPDKPNTDSRETENDFAQQNALEYLVLEKGSMVELFDKVSQRETVDFASTANIRPAKKANVPDNAMDTKVTQNDSPVTSIHEERPSLFEEQSADSPYEYSGGWGVRTETVPRATTSGLPEYLTKSLYTMTEEDETYVKSDSVYQEVLNGIDRSGAGSQDSVDDTRQVTDAPDDTSDDGGLPIAESKSVNSEFVDGLDDIDKFFQSVDPPDELDVGAVGSSIQEVLVGQSVKIVLNRIKLGFRFLRNRLGKVKARLDKYVSRRTTQDGEVALITREDIKSTVDSLKRLGKRAIHAVKDVVDDLFEDEEEGDVYDIDNGLDQVRAKIDSMRREQQRIQVPQRPNASNRMQP